jgi:hypothetical protein
MPGLGPLPFHRDRREPIKRIITLHMVKEKVFNDALI